MVARKPFGWRNDIRDISRLIHQIRKDRGIPQRVIGDAIGVTKSTVAKLENADMEPSISTLRAIARYYGYRVQVRLVPFERKE